MKIIFIISCFLIVSGCVRTKIIDEILFLSILGYGYKDEDKVEITASTPVFIQEKEAQNVIYSTTVNKDQHIISKLQRRANSPIATGNLMVTLFDEELAKKRGIIDHILFLKRDPFIGARVYIAFVDGEVKDLLDGTYGLRGNGHYVQNLIEHNIERYNLPEMNLHLFLYDYFKDGQDPIVPVLKKISKNDLEISGVALLKKDKMVGTVSHNKLFYLKLLTDRHTAGSLNVFSEEKKIAYENIKSSVKLKVEKRDPYVINVNINLKGVLRDYTDGNLTEQSLKEVEHILEKNITENINKLVEKFVELNIDPAGFGDFVRSRTRNFNFDKWFDSYSDLQVNVKTKVKILDTGTID